MGDYRLSLLIAVTLIAVLSAGVATVAAATCDKYTLDGDLSDWGVDLTGDWSKNETWLPNSGVRFLVEDNKDPRYKDMNGKPIGVHIRGIGTDYTTYFEPLVMTKDGLRPEPFQGEQYDLEAIYSDYDDTCLYFAIVTSVPPDARGDHAPGDLALDVDGNSSTGEYGYEYGVKLGTATGLSQWEIGYLPDWKVPSIVLEDMPTTFESYLPGGGAVGSAMGVYKDIGIVDNGYTNYVIELAIPLSTINTTHPAAVRYHIGDACGNDRIKKIPEFATLAVPLLMLFSTVALLYRRRQVL